MLGQPGNGLSALSKDRYVLSDAVSGYFVAVATIFSGKLGKYRKDNSQRVKCMEVYGMNKAKNLMVQGRQSLKNRKGTLLSRFVARTYGNHPGISEN